MKTIKNKNLFAYSCASPIRLPVIQAVANGSNASNLIVDSNPSYLGGNSIVWGLICGAKEIMSQTSAEGYDYFHVDNAYFGKNLFYRVTHNILHLTSITSKVINNRYKKILLALNKSILPWKHVRNGLIVICPSSPFLYSYCSTNLDDWICETISIL
jgi:hypothetical protein